MNVIVKLECAFVFVFANEHMENVGSVKNAKGYLCHSSSSRSRPNSKQASQYVAQMVLSTVRRSSWHVGPRTWHNSRRKKHFSPLPVMRTETIESVCKCDVCCGYLQDLCKRCISPSLVDDKHRTLFVCPSAACVRQDFSEVVQQCSLGSPELSLKALMAYHDVKTVASFVYRCLREAVPLQSRV
jgi:hypothetical protein